MRLSFQVHSSCRHNQFFDSSAVRTFEPRQLSKGGGAMSMQRRRGEWLLYLFVLGGGIAHADRGELLRPTLRDLDSGQRAEVSRISKERGVMSVATVSLDTNALRAQIVWFVPEAGRMIQLQRVRAEPRNGQTDYTWF